VNVRLEPELSGTELNRRNKTPFGFLQLVDPVTGKQVHYAWGKMHFPAEIWRDIKSMMVLILTCSLTQPQTPAPVFKILNESKLKNCL
jgi:hypothetical protein